MQRGWTVVQDVKGRPAAQAVEDGGVSVPLIAQTPTNHTVAVSQPRVRRLGSFASPRLTQPTGGSLGLVSADLAIDSRSPILTCLTIPRTGARRGDPFPPPDLGPGPNAPGRGLQAPCPAAFALMTGEEATRVPPAKPLCFVRNDLRARTDIAYFNTPDYDSPEHLTRDRCTREHPGRS